MPEIDLSVKIVMSGLSELDDLLDRDEFSGTQGTIYEEIYQWLRNPNFLFVDAYGSESGTGHRTVMIPGKEDLPCAETLLVDLFPDFHDLDEEYPNGIMELRMYQARRYLEACPSLRNIIFYGPVWDFVIWKMHRDSFYRCNVYLKLFFADYTRLKHKKR